MTGANLIKYHAAHILDCDGNKLVNLKQLQIAIDLPVQERMTQFMEQVQNPYLFRIDQLIVKVSFSGDRDLQSVIAALSVQS